MESVEKTNGIAKDVEIKKPFLAGNNGVHSGPRITVQQALYKWYNFFNNAGDSKENAGSIFPELSHVNLLHSFKTDIELVPSVLLDDFISNSAIQDKGQYIRLVQALLTNLSDCLFSKQDAFNSLCCDIENNLQFFQNFFYQQFDMDSRITKFSLHTFLECSKLKLDYWKIKLKSPILLNALEECLLDKPISPENIITYRKINYLKYLLKEVESVTTIISENCVRELFIMNNFNSACFVSYEIERLQVELNKFQTMPEAISFLQSQQERIAHLKIKQGVLFDNQLPSFRKQLSDWANTKIKLLEFENHKATGKDLLLDPESKIQTTFSVAKLAVLIRLLVADKIIINKSIAPMLRTVTKLFTTLQKDEISFGSLETKYHAPDKNTINSVKDIMFKWITILGKL